MKSNRQTIRSAIIRYFAACETINGAMLCEYCLEECRIPHHHNPDILMTPDGKLIMRYLRKLKAQGVVNYEYLGRGMYKNLPTKK